MIGIHVGELEEPSRDSNLNLNGSYCWKKNELFFFLVCTFFFFLSQKKIWDILWRFLRIFMLRSGKDN